MPISSLTGSSASRINEIENNYLNFEPAVDSRFYQYPLYTVPIGQTFAPEMIVNTGSAQMVSGSIVVEKIIHIFESETEAQDFINTTGRENIASIVRRPFIREDSSFYFKTEIQLINYSKLGFDLELKNLEIERGFKIEVFLSGSNGLEEIDDKPVFNLRGDLISDTYLKYFEIIPE